MKTRRPLTKAQKNVLACAFVPMLATGIAGGVGTYSNISGEYGSGTALGAVAAGEGATAVLALVLLGLTMLGQSSPWVIRAGLWTLPAAASAMSAMAADEPGRTVIYAVTPMGMCASAEGMAFLARRIVVHQDGRDAEAEAKAASVVRALAYHRARAANHPDAKVRERSERKSWRLAKHVGMGDAELGQHLVQVQRERLREGADAALADMLSVPSAAELPAAASAVEEPEVTTQVTIERAEPEPAEAVMPPVAALPPGPFMWDHLERPEVIAEVAAALPAEQPRQVVTEVVTISPAELRRQARRLHREAVRSTRRPVTIKSLQDELNLSRREATELRREIVEGDRS